MEPANQISPYAVKLWIVSRCLLKDLVNHHGPLSPQMRQSYIRPQKKLQRPVADKIF